MPPLPLTRPLAWASDDPHLNGPFAPTGTEVDAHDLTVVAGRIPDDLRGAYVRNGPNPRFEPASYTYPLEGDGMIHAVFFDNGRVRYSNRFVRTASFEVEDRAGHAVYGGLMAAGPVDPAALPKGDDGYKRSAFIGVLHHGDHLLALGEVEPAWEMSMELETLGPWTAGGSRPLDIGLTTAFTPSAATSLASPTTRCARRSVSTISTLRASCSAPSRSPSPRRA